MNFGSTFVIFNRTQSSNTLKRYIFSFLFVLICLSIVSGAKILYFWKILFKYAVLTLFYMFFKISFSIFFYNYIEIQLIFVLWLCSWKPLSVTDLLVEIVDLKLEDSHGIYNYRNSFLLFWFSCLLFIFYHLISLPRTYTICEMHTMLLMFRMENLILYHCVWSQLYF